MKIMTVRNYHPSFTNFSGYNYKDDENNNLLQYDDDDDDLDSYKKHDKSDAINDARVIGLMKIGPILGVLLGGSLGLVGGLGISSVERNDFYKKCKKILNSEDIKNDTFTVKDMTDDEKPDLILYKKDGSKVVVDIANQQILEETKDLTPVK